MASSYGTDADKSSLRSNYLVARRTIPARSRLESDASIRGALEAFPLFSEAPLVLTYVSRDAEVGTRPLIEALLSRGRRVAVPRVDLEAHDMTFHEIGSLDELVPRTMRILEPAAGAPVVTTPEMVGSVCLVPGLVFDGAGHRVGDGGGDYDRFRAVYCGLCRTMRRRCGLMAPMLLNFDFVFLALLLAPPEGERITRCHRCHVPPFRRREMCE